MGGEMRIDGRVIALETTPKLGARQALEPLAKPSALSLLPQYLRQAWHEARLRYWRRIEFRSRENAEARAAYAAMAAWEFEGINARQAWANWRTIPRNLQSRVPEYPLRALDLCCGTGHSTAVLAYHLADGSEILGLEGNPHFVARARSRTYFTRHGTDARVLFRAQSVLEELRDAEGERLDNASIDLVNSSGAIGCHFDVAATAALAGEVTRVVRPGGWALIDSGPAGTRPDEVRRIFERSGFELRHQARSCFVDRCLQLCFRKRRKRGVR